MTGQRVFLDSAMGFLTAQAELDFLVETSKFLTLNPTGTYSEARRAEAINQAALQHIANFFELSTSQVLPIHNFAAAIDFICNHESLACADVSISQISRRMLLQLAKEKLNACEVKVDYAGNERGDLATWHITQAGNPETGNIADVEEMAAKSRLVVDATEWIGRMPGLPNAEIVIVRATSWGAPTQICFLLNLKENWQISKFKRQQLAPASALLAASAQALRSPVQYAEIASKQKSWVVEFSQNICKLPDVSIPSETNQRLPHLISFMVRNLDAEVLAQALDRKGFAVGAGSACGMESGVSHVLAAMGHEVGTNIRIGLPLNSRQADLEKLAEVLPTAIAECRN